jgi:hypothetical protein
LRLPVPDASNPVRKPPLLVTFERLVLDATMEIVFVSSRTMPKGRSW